MDLYSADIVPTTLLYHLPISYAGAYHRQRAGDYYVSCDDKKRGRYDGLEVSTYTTQPSPCEVDVSYDPAFWA